MLVGDFPLLSFGCKRYDLQAFLVLELFTKFFLIEARGDPRRYFKQSEKRLERGKKRTANQALAVLGEDLEVFLLTSKL